MYREYYIIYYINIILLEYLLVKYMINYQKAGKRS